MKTDDENLFVIIIEFYKPMLFVFIVLFIVPLRTDSSIVREHVTLIVRPFVTKSVFFASIFYLFDKALTWSIVAMKVKDMRIV